MDATLAEIWQRLRAVQALCFVAHSEAGTGWDGTGEGVVSVSEPREGVLVFDESGRWHPLRGRASRFTNVFRWSLVGGYLRLEHLRFGQDRPVFLFDLAPGADGIWREISPHECREDCYCATVRVEVDMLIVHWTIYGPRKRESIEYTYR
jgi:hypothetical protein